MNVVARKSWSVRDNLAGLLAKDEDGMEVVLEISLTGIKVTEQQQVMMTHPLKRISYATCDPASCLFSFMSRETSAPPNQQLCHAFRLRTPCQAEELNNIVGTAFRVAYSRQVQREEEDRRMVSSHSAEDIFSSSEKRKSSKSLHNMSSMSSMSLTGLSSTQKVSSYDRLSCLDRKNPSPVTLPEYSQVFDMEEQEKMDNMAQDSGISSTSSSSHSYSVVPMEDCLGGPPWYQADMQR